MSRKRKVKDSFWRHIDLTSFLPTIQLDKAWIIQCIRTIKSYPHNHIYLFYSIELCILILSSSTTNSKSSTVCYNEFIFDQLRNYFENLKINLKPHQLSLRKKMKPLTKRFGQSRYIKEKASNVNINVVLDLKKYWEEIPELVLDEKNQEHKEETFHPRNRSRPHLKMS